jgi:hypothetical protein
MNALSEVKYTDEDVRRNPNLWGAAVEFLADYQGEFPFLRDCKARVEADIPLTVGMIRGVLNCMRVNPRVRDLPAPISLREEFDGDVIPAAERFVPQKRTCDIAMPHAHSGSDWAFMHYCNGNPRNDGQYSYRLPAKVNGPYTHVTAKSDTSVLIHIAVKVEFEWYPNIYGSGWARPTEMVITTNCRHPYSLRNGLLLDKKIIDKESEEWGLEYCSRCIYDGVHWKAIPETLNCLSND